MIARSYSRHASADMTKNYRSDYAKVVWSDAVPNLEISEIGS